MKNKHEQLGINVSTASNRLIKDLLFNFVIQNNSKCYRCNGALTRATFSVEHKTPWLHSDNPLELFFSLENIAYSHLICNTSAARRQSSKALHGTPAKYATGCKCIDCKIAEATRVRARYTKEKRRAKYLKHGY